MPGATRRTILSWTAAAVAPSALYWPQSARAADARRFAMALSGEPSYAPGFDHFNWVDTNAPKGGRLKHFANGSFDSLNAFPAQGVPAVGLGLVYDTLFARDLDSSSAAYGLIAEWAAYPDDFSSVTFGLRPEARFNDGTPITADDVVFSFETLKRVDPQVAQYYLNVVKAEKTGANEVHFTFDVANNHELPQIVSEMTVLPKHWWAGKTADGSARDASKSSLELPLGSGPYRVKAFESGRSIVYERVKDWWAAKLNVAKGQHNFDELEFSYYRDVIAPFEAFKRGDIDIWVENRAKSWATEYNFEAVKSGLVIKEDVPIKRVASMQAFVMNLRRPQFQDIRVRRALNLAYDFDNMNKNLFFSSYKRLGSYFDNSELASSGLPQGRELDILNSVRADLPPEVFTTDYKKTFIDGPQDARRNLAAASKLLAAAGYVDKGGVLADPQGRPLTIEFMLDNALFERVAIPYRDALKSLGVQMSVRTVDDSQYTRRVINYDYDMILAQIPQSDDPGNEQRDYFGTANAERPGGKNYAGIRNPAIDAIIQKVVLAKDRAELVDAVHALDRALLWNFYVVPQYYLGGERLAYWNKFGQPAKRPSRTVAYMQTWWIDPAKDTALALAKAK